MFVLRDESELIFRSVVEVATTDGRSLMVAAPRCEIFVLLGQLRGLHFHVRIHRRDDDLFVAAGFAPAKATNKDVRKK